MKSPNCQNKFERPVAVGMVVSRKSSSRSTEACASSADSCHQTELHTSRKTDYSLSSLKSQKENMTCLVTTNNARARQVKDLTAQTGMAQPALGGYLFERLTLKHD